MQSYQIQNSSDNLYVCILKGSSLLLNIPGEIFLLYIIQAVSNECIAVTLSVDIAVSVQWK